MSLTEGLLILVVIILTVMILSNKGERKSNPEHRSWDCVDKATGAVTTVNIDQKHTGELGCKCDKCNAPEKASQKEHAEFFAASSSHPAAASESCSDDNMSYAINPYGGPGIHYHEWMTAQAIDPQIVSNHTAFVKDRTNQGNWTAIAYSPSSNDSYDPIPWQGILGRPQAVAVANPTQVPDIDQSLYAKTQKVVWRSS